MATRFYLPSSGAAAVSPAFDTAWEQTSGADRLRAVTAKSSTAMATKSLSESLASFPGDVLLRQYTTDRIAAGTISGTVKGQIRVRESDSGADVCSQLVIKVVSADGATLRGILFAANVAALSNEWSTTLTNRKYPRGWTGSGASLTAVTAQDGDRLVFEIGGRVHVDAPPLGAGLDIRFGDTGSTDLPEDEATTIDDVPWLEFSQTISPFVQITAAQITATGRLDVSGTGPDFEIRARMDIPSDNELTTRLRSWEIRRGRRTNLERAEAATATALFKNGDGAPLDPANIDSPHYPHVRVLALMTLARRKGGIDYPRFRGRIERFVPTWQPPAYQEQQAGASDAFEALTALKIESGKATLTTALAGADNDLLFIAREAGGRGEEISVAYIVAGTNTSLSGDTNDPLSGDAVIESAPSMQQPFGLIGGLIGGGLAAPPPTLFEISGSAIKINVSTDGSGNPTATAAQIKALIESVPELDALITVQLAPGNSGAGVVTAMAATYLTGGKWPQEKTGARINRVLDLAGWPASLRRIDPGLFNVIAQGFAKRDNVSALAHIQDVADSELGYFFISADGYAVFHDGGHRGNDQRSTVSQATYADAAAGAGYFYNAISPEYSKDRVYNRVSVTPGYQGAEPQIVEDVASQLLYSPVPGVPVPREYTKQTLLALDADAFAVAQAILAAYKDAKIRFPEITLIERDDPAGWVSAVQGRELGDLVTIRTKPPGHTTVGVYDCYIEEIRDVGQPGRPQQVTFALSLASEALDVPASGGPLKDSSGDDFILDDATAGVLG